MLRVSVGDKFDLLEVIKEYSSTKKKHRMCLVKCKCGTIREARISSLISTQLTSCGCKKHKFDYDKVTVGQRFNALTITKILDKSLDKHNMRICLARCDCGKKVLTRIEDLLTNHRKSCGCKNSCRTHGEGYIKTSEYAIWCSMRQRCSNNKNHAWKSYGGRGITVCDRWKSSYENFLLDMGRRPPGHSLDRINNDGNYEPANCRWATRRQQATNTRWNRYIEWRGQRKALCEWADILKMNPTTLRCRLENWPLEKAMATPLLKQNKIKVQCDGI
jgi:hypothetical protein